MDEWGWRNANVSLPIPPHWICINVDNPSVLLDHLHKICTRVYTDARVAPQLGSPTSSYCISAALAGRERKDASS